VGNLSRLRRAQPGKRDRDGLPRRLVRRRPAGPRGTRSRGRRDDRSSRSLRSTHDSLSRRGRLVPSVSLSLALILGAATWHAGGSEQRRSQGGLTPGPEPRTRRRSLGARRARRIPSATVTVPRRIMIHSTMVHRDVGPAVAPGPDPHEESWQRHRVNARAQSPPPTDSSREASKVRRFRGAGS
jgi:hypothetical protein